MSPSICANDWLDVEVTSSGDTSLVPPVEHGLLIGVASSKTVLHHARRVFEGEMLTGGPNLGLPFPAGTQVRSLYTGPGRRYRTIEALRRAPEKGCLKLEHVSERGHLSWTGPEGLALIRERLSERNDQWLTAELLVDSFDGEFRRGLIELRASAKQCKCRVFLFVFSNQGRAPDYLSELADEHARLEECDDEPECVTAFAVLWAGLDDLDSLGHRPVQCVVKAADSRSFSIEFLPHISTDLQGRFMWLLRECGLTNKEIADIVDINKATVGRHMKDLPPPGSATDPEASVLRYADAMKLDLEQLKTALARAKARRRP
jgi:hypothetical protein